MLHTFADRFRKNFGRSLARLVAPPEYPVNDFADDPDMRGQQKFLAVKADADSAVRAGSGFVDSLFVPLSRILPLIPRKDMDMILDALGHGHDGFSGNRMSVMHLDDMPDAIVVQASDLGIKSPSYEACARSLHDAAFRYQSDIASACANAAIRLRSAKPTYSRGISVDGKYLGGLHSVAQRLRVRGEPVREFLREYERAEDMLFVHLYLAARKAGNQATMDSLREESAVSLFLRCGDLDE